MAAELVEFVGWPLAAFECPFAFSLDFCPSFEWSERERINSAEEECASDPEYEKERKGMPFLALLLAFFTHLNGHTRSLLQDERGGEGQKPPTCEDKASDSSCDKEKEEGANLGIAA